MPEDEALRIRLGVSACLLGDRVRYAGGHKRDAFLTDVLGPFVEWVPVCPEVRVTRARHANVLQHVAGFFKRDLEAGRPRRARQDHRGVPPRPRAPRRPADARPPPRPPARSHVVLPGLGGITGMSLLLPFLYGMDHVDALALLVGLIAVIPTSDTFTSVLMGIGYVLSLSAETYLYQAIQFYGWGWISRPGVLVIVAVTAVSVYLGARYSPATRVAAAERAVLRRWPQVAFAALIAAVFVLGIVDAWDRRLLGRVFPLSIAVVMLGFALYTLVRIAAGRAGHVAVFDAEAEAVGDAGPSAEHYLAWRGAFLVAGYLVGFVPAVTLFFAAFLKLKARATALINVVLTASAVAFLAIMGRLLAVHYPPGLLQDLVDLPWPLG